MHDELLELRTYIMNNVSLLLTSRWL